MSTFSDVMSTKLNTINNKFYSALDDFSSSYVNSKLYPGGESQKIFLNNQGIIDSLQAELFIATNDIQSNIDNLTSVLLNLNAKIESEKAKNVTLNSQFTSVSSQSNGSSLLVNESDNLYFDRYISNATFIVGIILGFIITFRVFSLNP
jgi:hypothetical protein